MVKNHTLEFIYTNLNPLHVSKTMENYPIFQQHSTNLTHCDNFQANYDVNTFIKTLDNYFATSLLITSRYYSTFACVNSLPIITNSLALSVLATIKLIKLLIAHFAHVHPLTSLILILITASIGQPWILTPKSTLEPVTTKSLKSIKVCKLSLVLNFSVQI